MAGESGEVLEQLGRNDGCGDLREMMWEQRTGRTYPNDMQSAMR